MKKNISPLSTPNQFAKNYVNLLKKIIPHKDKFIFFATQELKQ